MNRGSVMSALLAVVLTVGVVGDVMAGRMMIATIFGCCCTFESSQKERVTPLLAVSSVF